MRKIDGGNIMCYCTPSIRTPFCGKTSCAKVPTNPINDGDITFSIRFEIKSHIMKGQFSEFDCVEIGTDTFEPTRVYQSKKEAIDSLIDSLLKIKDIDAQL